MRKVAQVASRKRKLAVRSTNGLIISLEGVTVTDQKELSGWRQIADYLGVSVRTAQAYEQSWGLPIRRLPGKKGRIWATTADLAAWKERLPCQMIATGTEARQPSIVESECENGSVDSELLKTGFSRKLEEPFGGHWVHALITSIIFGLMLASTVPLEVAFAYDRYAGLVWMSVPAVFVAAMIATMVSLLLDVELTRRGQNVGLVASTMTLILSSVVNYAAVRPHLSAFPLTQANFQTWSAQAAYLKGLVYCTAFTGVFLLLAFHFVITMQREFLADRHGEGFELLARGWLGVAPAGAPYLPSWVFGVLLLVGAIYSILSTAHLLEALKVTPYTNLFIQLIEIRWVLFLALGVECCWWYYSSVNELKRESGAMYRYAPLAQHGAK